MYISEISFVNIRSYKKITLNLSKGINIIIGPNNSGKSTILKAIQNLQKGILGLNSGDVRKGIHMGKTYFVINDTVPEENKFFSKNLNQSNAGSEKKIMGVFYNDGRTEGKETMYFLNLDGKFIHSENDFEFQTIDPNTNASNFYEVFPLFPDSEDQGNFLYMFLSKRKVNSYGNQVGRLAANSVTDQFHYLPAKIKRLHSASHPRYLEFQSACNSILHFVPSNVAHPTTSDDTIGFLTDYTQTIAVDSMGDGVVNIIGLLSTLYTADGKLYLLEEIENDVHPTALKRLLDVIVSKAEKNQFIITTHSHIVLKHLAAFPGSRIFYTDSKIEIDSRGAKIPTSTIEEIENTPEARLDVLSKLGYEVLDFELYSSYLLFEESSAEQIVKEFIIPTFVPELQNRLKTIAANGAPNLEVRFSDLHRLFVYLHTAEIYKGRVWVIADGDRTGKECIQRLREKFHTWDESHFSTLICEDFELYYPDHFRMQFEIINETADKKEKKKQKGLLTKQVLEWINLHKSEAEVHFRTACAEIISLLRHINTKI